MTLPIDAVLPELIATLATHDACVLEAPPGAGKTTRVPLAALEAEWLRGQKILMLEPRRLAARAAAERMAQTLGEPVGERVGYRVRLDSKVSARTRIEVVTEGILNRMLQDDPALEGVGLLIFDEFHERSLDADLGLALALAGRELYGDLRNQTLKLLVMSATLDGERVAALLDHAPRVQSEGRSYPVDLRYGQPWRPGQRLDERVEQAVLQALADQPGSLLVFLPGQGEIQRLADRLTTALAGDATVQLAPLFGNLDFSAQRAAIEPAPAGVRKVVLATNIAETSLTIEGISAVVDAGLCREPQFDPGTGLTRLVTRRISRAASVQRAGRAGRLGPGVCYRLWSESQQQELAAHTRPEMEQADLAPMALQLLNWGIRSPDELRWLTPPPPGSWSQALSLLAALGAIEARSGQWTITTHGQAMAGIAAHPRLAHLLVMAAQWGLTAPAAQLAALLSERDPLPPSAGADVQTRLGRRHGRLPQIADQLARQVRAIRADKTVEVAEAHQPGLLLALAYPDRIARQRSGQRGVYQLANGRSARLAETDRLCSAQWLVAAHTGGREGSSADTIYLAAELSPTLFDGPLADQVSVHTRMQWDDANNRFVAEEQRLVGRLVLSAKPLTKVDPEQKREALLALVAERGLALLAFSEDCRQWQGRVQLLRQTLGTDWPDVTDDGLLASLGQWLGPYLDGVNTLVQLQKLDVLAMLQSLLSWEQTQSLNKLAPSALRVPSGSHIALDYTQSPPVLAVKLQEMFGCLTTPTLVDGRVPVLVHLLSPARRPLQITQDLAGFWSGSYEAVKKDMKGRYPKHPWPDNPLEALPTAKTKRAQARDG